MYYRDKIMISNDLEWLRQQLLDAQNLNRELHRRLQSCEGGDLRLEEMRSRMTKELATQAKHTDYHRQQSKSWASKFYNIQRKCEALPTWVKWFMK